MSEIAMEKSNQDIWKVALQNMKETEDFGRRLKAFSFFMLRWSFSSILHSSLTITSDHRYTVRCQTKNLYCAEIISVLCGISYNLMPALSRSFNDCCKVSQLCQTAGEEVFLLRASQAHAVKHCSEGLK